MGKEVIARAEEIIAGRTGSDTYCALSLIDEEGFPTTSTITASGSEGIGRIWFGTGLESNKARRIRGCDKACVLFNDASYNITLVGTVTIRTDGDSKKAAWYQGLEQHFSGPEDPQFCVLEFRTQRYNLFVDWQEAVGTV